MCMIGAGGNVVRKVTTLWFIAVEETSLILELRREDLEICEEEIEEDLKKHFGLDFFCFVLFSSQKFLYLVYPTEKKTALFYTIFIHYIPLCNRKKDTKEFLLIRKVLIK